MRIIKTQDRETKLAKWDTLSPPDQISQSTYAVASDLTELLFLQPYPPSVLKKSPYNAHTTHYCAPPTARWRDRLRLLSSKLLLDCGGSSDAGLQTELRIRRPRQIRLAGSVGH